jgi:hypothetical protein
MYYVSVPHASPQLLSVKGMRQAMLAQKFDGVGSRLKMALRWEDGRLTIRDPMLNLSGSASGSSVSPSVQNIARTPHL